MHVNWLKPARPRVQKILLTDLVSLFTAVGLCFFFSVCGVLYRYMAGRVMFSSTDASRYRGSVYEHKFVYQRASHYIELAVVCPQH